MAEQFEALAQRERDAQTAEAYMLLARGYSLLAEVEGRVHGSSQSHEPHGPG